MLFLLEKFANMDNFKIEECDDTREAKKADFACSLAARLQEYVQSGIYPMHMPGHKRNMPDGIREKLQSIWTIDLTEVEGSDSLHHASGIIKDAHEYAAGVFGAGQSFFLVNGSSCGILASVRSVVREGRFKLIMAKESHISAYNALELNRLEGVLVESYAAEGYSHFSSKEEMHAKARRCSVSEEALPCKAGVNTEALRLAIKEHHKEACAVFITSPTYEGIVSDIHEIAKMAHGYGLPLIVDEAHGAHLHFMKEYLGVGSAISMGADLVVQSTHKTLPALTQTAILHISKDSKYVDGEKVRESLSIFESSSPSYVLMSSIDLAIRYMVHARREIAAFMRRLEQFYEKCRNLHNVQVVREFILGETKLSFDKTKVVVFAKGMTGLLISNILRTDYNMETEMATKDYALCMLTIGDTAEGIARFWDALHDLDGRLEKKNEILWNQSNVQSRAMQAWDDDVYDEAGNASFEKIDSLCGTKAEQHVYAFPPDIPIVAKGEVFTQEHVRAIKEYVGMGMKIYGL